MNKNEKIAFWVAGGVGVVVLLFLIVYRRTQSTEQTTYYPDSPNYMTYNYPGTDPWTGYANGLPKPAQSDSGAGNTTYNIGGGNCCGCGDSGSPIAMSINSLLNTFAQASKDNFNKYQQTVYSSYPSTVTQYFNNPGGVAMYIGGSNTFRENQ